MSVTNRHCEGEQCFAHKPTNTCDCLDITYETYLICPFYKTKTDLKNQIKKLKAEGRILK